MSAEETILLAHGSGGKLTHDLIDRVFMPHFDNPILGALLDSAVLPHFESPDRASGIGHQASQYQWVFTTDSYVVKPPIFPGGDIGRLAVCGTVNDLAVVGAKPLFLSASFILEEGLRVELLARVVSSMRQAAEEAGVAIVAGDTKVVERGAADQIFVTTAGVGIVEDGPALTPDRIVEGDAVVVSGTIGDHGIAVLAAQADFELEVPVESDCAPIASLVAAVRAACPGLRFARDPTRGGLATTLNEVAKQTGLGLVIEEEKVPIKPAVVGACHLLGFDPLYLANEGKAVFILDPADLDAALETLRGHPLGTNAAEIGRVVAEPAGRVGLRTRLGSTRALEMLVGEQLPRIC